MDSLIQVVAPIVVGALTVPIMNALRGLVGVLDRAPSLVKQLAVVGIAYGLTALGSMLGVALPEGVELFTAGDVETLLSALMAFAIYDGKKTVAAAALAAMMLAMPGGASAQVVQDSVSVTIYDRSDLNLVISPQDYRGFRGDTVTFTAVAIDGPTGDTLDVDLLWTVDNPSAVTIDPQTGFATFNNRGQYNVYVEVTAIRLLDMAFFGQAGDLIGSSQWTEFTDVNPLRVVVGERAQLCNYIIEVESAGDGSSTSVTPISKSESLCPNMGGTPLPVVAVDWSSSDPSIVCFSDECPVEPFQEGSLLRQAQAYSSNPYYGIGRTRVGG